MDMKQVDKISMAELKEMAQKMFGEIVKADVDVANNKVIIDMPMHSDGEAQFLADGSKQKDLWGINLHPEEYGSDDFIEFDSMINIKPSQNNASKDVLDEAVRSKIRQIIGEVVHE